MLQSFNERSWLFPYRFISIQLFGGIIKSWAELFRLKLFHSQISLLLLFHFFQIFWNCSKLGLDRIFYCFTYIKLWNLIMPCINRWKNSWKWSFRFNRVCSFTMFKICCRLGTVERLKFCIWWPLLESYCNFCLFSILYFLFTFIFIPWRFSLM